jgi:hypothetical protein
MNDKQVKFLLRNKEVGIHSAGNGLYLRVNDKGLVFGLSATAFSKSAEK